MSTTTVKATGLTIEHEGTLNTQAVADAIVEAGFTPAV